MLNLQVDSELTQAGVAREVVNRFQKLRKKAGLVVTDSVEVFYSEENGSPSGSLLPLQQLLQAHQTYLQESLGRPLLHLRHKPAHAVVIASESTTVGTQEDGTLATFTAVLAAPAAALDQGALVQACGGSQELVEGVTAYVASRDMLKLQAQAAAANGSVPVKVDGKTVVLTVGKELFFGAAAAAAAVSSAL